MAVFSRVSELKFKILHSCGEKISGKVLKMNMEAFETSHCGDLPQYALHPRLPNINIHLNYLWVKIQIPNQ